MHMRATDPRRKLEKLRKCAEPGAPVPDLVSKDDNDSGPEYDLYVGAVAAISTEPDSRTFPVHAFPDVVRRYIVESARAMGIPAEMIGTPALAALGALIGPGAEVIIKSSWTEPPNVWTAVVGAPGSGKTPAIRAALDGVYALQDAAHGQYKVEREDYEVKSKLARNSKLAIANESVEQPVEPKLTHFVATDATKEALLSMLEHSNGIVAHVDELSGWVASFDAYRGGKGGDRAAFLSLWSGTSTKVDRKSQNEHIYIKQPVLCVVGGIQPDLLSVFKNERGDDGFLDRILFVYCDAPAPPWTDDDVSSDLKLAYDSFCKRLSHLRRAGERVSVRLSRDARAAYIAWHTENNDRINAGSAAAGFYAKLRSYVPRIALILHCAKHERPGEHTISEQTMFDAVELGEFYAEHMRRVRANLGQLVPAWEAGIAGRVQRCLRNQALAGIEWVGHSDLLRRLGNVKAPQLEETVKVLIENGRLEPRTRQTETKPRREYRLVSNADRLNYSNNSNNSAGVSPDTAVHEKIFE
jgi:hypothetical protein